MSKTLKHLRKNMLLKGQGPLERPNMRSRWPQDGLKSGYVELRSAKMCIRGLKMGKISDTMKQDGAKMRKMRDVSSVFDPDRRYEGERPANKVASRYVKETPDFGLAQQFPTKASDDLIDDRPLSYCLSGRVEPSFLSSNILSREVTATRSP